MLFSYNWISELIEGLETPPRDLLGLITTRTAECEGIEEVGAHFAHVVAARVLSVGPLPGGRNRKAVVDAGPLGQRTVVCGAPNCRAGIVTAYVPSGTVLEGRSIDKRSFDGVESDGMLAAAAELGISKDHDAILEIDATPGTPLDRLLPDHAIEVDNKSLTHRPDLWGHHGMAREVAAITGKALRDPVDLSLLPAGAAGIEVAIEDTRLCPRYSALVLENASVQPSPLWLQYRLQAVGLNPINNIVDVTNWVMAELAQPMHAFDADKLHGGIVVRPALEGESITALNGEAYELTPAELLITDAAGPVAIAGVIGGMESAIGAGTTRIVLESANFQAASIRRASSRLKLRTDASMRFEKAQDPVNTVRGLARALELLRIVSPGIRVTGGLADVRGPLRTPAPVELPLDFVTRKLGRQLEPAEVRRILESLLFGVTEARPGVLSVTIPSWRATKDISIKEDLVEEIGRIIGYDTITPVAPVVPTAPPPANPRRLFLRGLRHAAAAQGFTEVYNYSFLSEDTVRRFGLDPAAHVRVLNPISVEQSLMRTTLVPGIWRNVLENAKHLDVFRLFEVGHEIHKRAEGLPDEVPHLVAAVYERNGDTGPFVDAKRLAECLMPGCSFSPAAAAVHEHPSRAATITWRGATAGRLFEFHPNFVEGRAAIVDVDAAALERLSGAGKRYRPVRRFPSSDFDLSVIAGRRALIGDIESQIVSFAGPRLEEIVFLRQYEGPPLADGVKSVSFRLTVADTERTLASEEVNTIRDGIIAGMRALGYELRV